MNDFIRTMLFEMGEKMLTMITKQKDYCIEIFQFNFIVKMQGS